MKEVWYFVTNFKGISYTKYMIFKMVVSWHFVCMLRYCFVQELLAVATVEGQPILFHISLTTVISTVVFKKISSNFREVAET